MALTVFERLGRDYCTSKEHLTRWRDALNEGRRTTPRCTAITRMGSQCRMLPLRDGRPGVHLCWHHARGAARDEIDRKREARAIRWSVSGNARKREQGITALAVIHRRRAWKALKADPSAAVQILLLSDADERNVTYWLRDHGLDGALTETGRPITNYSRERARYAAVMSISERITAEAARRRVVSIVQWEVAYWHKVGGA
ncbi:hypothetical protein [Bosea sp. NBC_00550]|uniref:hypothetical protein n=1 Tax=Bosea sp. NBC_00550 TaxID=2969621 RepID=UPI0022327ECB|nr:hypothetical protein [Bosea sp. NBC_00550]UZF93017.1 hypothetical protein NWE53_02025 [Bosea sp. NBC_00550]